MSVERELGPAYVTKDSGEKAVHSDGVQRDIQDGKTLFTLLFPKGVPMNEQLIVRVAELYTRGAAKYGGRNWENTKAADTLEHHEESLWRHFMAFYFGVEDGEDHAAAIVWNINAVEMGRRNLRKPNRPAYDLPLDDPAHKCVQGLCDDHAGPAKPESVVGAREYADILRKADELTDEEADAAVKAAARESNFCTKPERDGRIDLCPGGRPCGERCQITGFLKTGSRQQHAMRASNGSWY